MLMNSVSLCTEVHVKLIEENFELSYICNFVESAVLILHIGIGIFSVFLHEQAGLIFDWINDPLMFHCSRPGKWFRDC